MPFKHPTKQTAFTLIEMTIVIVVLAILTVALAVSYQKMALKARYDAHLAVIERMFQDARSRSLSTVLIHDSEPTEYYEVNVESTGVTLIAYGESLSEVIETYTFDEDIQIAYGIKVYYFPPNGEICLTIETCASEETELSTTLDEDSGTYSTTLTITSAGGGILEMN